MAGSGRGAGSGRRVASSAHRPEESPVDPRPARRCPAHRPGHARGRAAAREIHLERPARREHGDWSSQRGPGHGQEGRAQPPRAGRRAGRARSTPRRRAHVAGGRDRRPRLRQLPPGRHLAARRAAPTSSTSGVDGYARLDLGAGHQGQRRVRERQPHRARSTPATAGAPPTATRWPGCSSACGYDGRRASTT